MGENSAFLKLEDSNSSRFSIPEHVVNRGAIDPKMNLSMTNFAYETDPFTFSFKDS